MDGWLHCIASVLMDILMYKHGIKFGGVIVIRRRVLNGMSGYLAEPHIRIGAQEGILQYNTLYIAVRG